MMHAKIVLVINNNPDGSPGRYTSQLCQRVIEANAELVEARTLEAVDSLANEVGKQSDVGLIITCGSPLVLTDPQNLQDHITKTTAAMLHFPNAPVVGICFGMQLLACLYGGEIRSHVGHGHTPGQYTQLKRLDVPSRFLEGAPADFVQWASNYIFVERVPSRFIATSTDQMGRIMSMEHAKEHVYGVQFHPEVLHEVLGSKLIDGMMSLLGRNRRDVELCKKDCTLEGISWKCSDRCSLRRAIREATRCTSPSRAISNCNAPAEMLLGKCGEHAGELAKCLAAAKRDAMTKLQKDHCRHGGITANALRDAISALRGLASTCQLPMETCTQEANGTITPHEADLQLRAVIKDSISIAFPSDSKKKPCFESPICTISIERQQPAAREARDKLQRIRNQGLGDDMCSLHQADLYLRRVVREELGNDGLRFPGLGAALSAAKSAELMQLRTTGLHGLAASRIEESTASIRATASRFRLSASSELVC